MPRCETELRAPGDSKSELPASTDTALPVRSVDCGKWSIVRTYCTCAQIGARRTLLVIRERNFEFPDVI